MAVVEVKMDLTGLEKKIYSFEILPIFVVVGEHAKSFLNYIIKESTISK